ncbi:hypothetical protein [Planomonospora sp. ID82291]|uniref:hypothetical protein n=1 Tax=Planomonospora sp. ID82291 TaxID=2738136 RepID=UPI0018C3DA25|nr:hypothetical protein [Planomonospora sp. ID82291]MBG0815576.1 hypothetical protein [Planomonospora sp. ID82291]
MTTECGKTVAVTVRLGEDRHISASITPEDRMRVSRFLVLVLAAVLVTAGCTREPELSLDKAVAELRKDAQRFEADDVFKNPLVKLKILQRPDKDIPCGEGKFKRVLRLTADDERKDADVDGHLDLAERLMQTTLDQVMGYEVEYDFDQLDALEGRFIHGNKKIGVTVDVHVAPESPTWRLRAETACLAR